MSSINSIKNSLKPLGIYKLNTQGLLNAELSAYACELDTLNAEIEKLEKECFVSTAEDYGITLREQLYDFSKPLWDVSKKRQRILGLALVTPNSFTKADLESILQIYGIEAIISEDLETGNIYINCISKNDLFENVFSSASKNESSTINQIEKFMPAHLTFEVDFATISWNVIEQLDNTFEQMDAKGYKWDKIDSY